MKPIDFHGSNGVRTAPEDMPAVGDLPVFTDGLQCISCWDLTEEERQAIALGEPLWFAVVSGRTQPPIRAWVDLPKSAPLDLPIEEMAALDFIRWDRYVERPERVTVFGWIDRADGRADFALLYVTPAGLGYATSSADWSGEIGRRLQGEEAAEPSTGHKACLRVEDHPRGRDLENVIRLRSPQRAPERSPMPERPPAPYSAPDGFRWETSPLTGLEWKVEAGGTCRRLKCNEPGVAVLYRACRGRRHQRWRYCAAHLYGWWIEDGQVLSWRLVPAAGGAS